MVVAVSHESEVELTFVERSDKKVAKRLNKLEKTVAEIKSDVAVIQADVAATKVASEATRLAVQQIQQTLQDLVRSGDEVPTMLCELKNIIRPIDETKINPDFIMCKYLCTI